MIRSILSLRARSAAVSQPRLPIGFLRINYNFHSLIESEANYHSITDPTFDSLIGLVEQLEECSDAVEYNYSVIHIIPYHNFQSNLFYIARSAELERGEEGNLGHKQTDAE